MKDSPADLMLKDLGLAQDAALSAHCATPLGALARQLYQLHSQSGRGVLDFSSIVDMFRQVASHGPPFVVEIKYPLSGFFAESLGLPDREFQRGPGGQNRTASDRYP